MAAVRPRITVVTAAHLSTCPRMLKAADALAAAGYAVRVVSTRSTPWAWSADQVAMQTRNWTWRVVDYDRSSARPRQVATGVRMRGARAAFHLFSPPAVAARVVGRVHDELVDAIVEEPADFIYGGTSGALAAVDAAAGRLGVPFGLDLEDFHTGEQVKSEGELLHHAVERIEREVLPRATVLTTASPMIADAYLTKYGRRPLPIHNTFSVSFGAPRDSGDSLRLYWFSQTLGPGRGLDDVVRAVGRSGVRAELHVRARPIDSYLAHLRSLCAAAAPLLTLVQQDPAPPDEMVALSQGYDVGLACEEPDVLNRRLCLTNKIFTYLAAGVPVALTATPAQAALARDLGPAAFLYEAGNVEALSGHLRRMASDPGVVRCAQTAARAAAERRWHWEHPDDRGALLGAIASAVEPLALRESHGG